MRKALLLGGFLSLSMAMAVTLSACDSDSSSSSSNNAGSGSPSPTAAAQTNQLRDCPISVVNAYNQLVLDAQSLDLQYSETTEGSQLAGYKQSAMSLLAEAQSFVANYSSDDSCLATENGSLFQVDPSNGSNLVNLLKSQIAAINQYEENGSSGLPTLSPISSFPTTNSSVTCASMQAREVSIGEDAQTLTDEVQQDFNMTGTTSRSTAQVRGELSAFLSEYQSLSCPDANMSASQFVSTLDGALDELDVAISKIQN